jgi:ketosteroid isomerase-like protein
METSATRELIERFVAARNEGDQVAVAAMLSDDVEFHPPASMPFGPFVGRDAVVEALAGGAVGHLIDMATVNRTVERILVEGDTAVALQSLTG